MILFYVSGVIQNPDGQYYLQCWKL